MREILRANIPCPKKDGLTVRIVTSSPPSELEIECKAGGKIKLTKSEKNPYEYEAICYKCRMTTKIIFKPDAEEAYPKIDVICLLSEEEISVDTNSGLTTNPECPHYHTVCPHSQGKGFLIVGPITQQDRGKGKKIECTHCGARSYLYNW